MRDAAVDASAAREAAAKEVAEIRADVLPHYDGWEGSAITRLGAGLINRSYLLRAPTARARCCRR